MAGYIIRASESNAYAWLRRDRNHDVFLFVGATMDEISQSLHTYDRAWEYTIVCVDDYRITTITQDNIEHVAATMYQQHLLELKRRIEQRDNTMLSTTYKRWSDYLWDTFMSYDHMHQDKYDALYNEAVYLTQ